MICTPHRILCESSNQERMVLAGNVACTVQGKGDVRTGFWWGYLRERYQLEGIRIDRRKILKSIKAWTGLIWLRIGTSGRVL